ncbi:MAG: ABC transporter ATP-binding protein [Bacteroidales bacterium]|nr:ABC transporter ATP-binding protein [Bacteroidales bacterium]
MIRAENIHRSFGELEVLKGIDLEIPEGEIVSLVGASGAGKTTLLHILGTLDKPDRGRVFINGGDVSALGEKRLAAFRNRHIGFIFQFHHLLPEFTALENVFIPALIAGQSRSVAEKRAEELLEIMDLADRSHHKPAELSGGEQQRVAVARALVNEPSVILADEPSGNLDSASALELHKLFFRLREQFRQTYMIVTHNTGLAGMADRKLTIRDGVIEKQDILTGSGVR